MKRLLLAVVSVCTLVGISSTAHALTLAPHLWSQRFGGTLEDRGQSVVVDGSGNVLVTGYFQGTVNFGGGNLTSAGYNDIFVAKYNVAGVHQWSQRFGSGGDDRGHSVAVDGSGNVLVTGYFEGTVNFGGGNLGSAGSYDIFVAKYNAAGMHQWSQRFGSTLDDIGYSVAVDGAGNVLVTGLFQNTVNFGGSNLTSVADSYDIFVAKYNAAGVHQWSQRFGGTLFDYGYSVAVDGAGNVLVTGLFWDTVNLGGGNLTSAGESEIFVAKYNAAGVHQWSQRFGGTLGDSGYSVAVDGAGNVLVTGLFQDTVNFGGSNLTSAGSYDIFVAKYNAAGVHQWSQRFGTTSDDIGYSVAVDGSENVLVTGYFRGTVNFGGSDLMSTLGASDIFVAKYNAAGVHQWSQRFGGASYDYGNSVAVDGSENVLITGYFGSANFGGGTLTSAGFSDIFLAKYAGDAAEPVISAITDIGNDQGRHVKITFDHSGGDDVAATAPIVRYDAFRRSDGAPALTGSLASVPKPELLSQGWTEVGSVHAYGEREYSIDVPTIGDSTIALGQYYSVFYVRAATEAPPVFFDSAPDSGYSVDNLAPGVPQNFVYNAGALSWKESSAADFDFFTVYGSNTDCICAATVVDYSVAPLLNVAGSPYVFYFVTATDFSGNEGKPAKVNTLSGVGGTPKSYVLSVSNYPNPFNPRTTVSYTVPSRGAVTVAVYDARGARVATLIDHADRAAGPYSIAWDGRAQSGATVSTGVYFARIEHNGATRSKKMVLLK